MVANHFAFFADLHIFASFYTFVRNGREPFLVGVEWSRTISIISIGRRDGRRRCRTISIGRRDGRRRCRTISIGRRDGRRQRRTITTRWRYGPRQRRHPLAQCVRTMYVGGEMATRRGDPVGTL